MDFVRGFSSSKDRRAQLISLRPKATLPWRSCANFGLTSVSRGSTSFLHPMLAVAVSTRSVAHASLTALPQHCIPCSDLLVIDHHRPAGNRLEIMTPIEANRLLIGTQNV